MDSARTQSSSMQTQAPAQPMGDVEYVWLPMLRPKTNEISEYSFLPAQSSPEADYALWLEAHSKRIANTQPQDENDIVVDAVLRCPLITKFDVMYTTHMSGMSSDVQEARTSVLNMRGKMTVVATVQAPRDFVFTNTLELREFVAERLGQVQSSSGTEITFLTDSPTSEETKISNSEAKNGKDAVTFISSPTEDLITIQIRGTREDVSAARTQLLVLLDQCAGFECDVFDGLTLLQQYATLGSNGNNIFDIMRRTGTKIYLASPLDVYNKLPPSTLVGWESRTDKCLNTIYITGLRPDIEKAKTALLEAANMRIVSSTITLTPRKLEWILLTQGEYIHAVMRRCGVFIAFPAVGSVANFATIYGTELSLVFKAVRDIAALACEYHEVFLHMFPLQMYPNHPNSGTISGGMSGGSNSNSPLLSSSPSPSGSPVSQPHGLTAGMINTAQFCRELSQISETTGAEIVLLNNMVAIYGPHSVVAPALSSVINCNQFQRCRNSLAVETEIRIELAQKHEDFLKGKHCGKVKKLVQGSQVRYNFEESITESNIVIHVFSPLRTETLSAYYNLNLELPVEMSLYIPESEHHKMIGEKGRNSQKLSTKYHAFLRFSSRAEQTEIGGYFRLSHNVFALTPAKYSNGFESLLQDLVLLYREVCALPSVSAANNVSINNGGKLRNFTRFGNSSSSGSSSPVLSNVSTDSQASSPLLAPVSLGSGINSSSSFISKLHNGDVQHTTVKPPFTQWQVAFSHRYLHFLLPLANELESKYSVKIMFPCCNVGFDYITFQGSYSAISLAINDALIRATPQSICIETLISSKFVESKFAASVDVLVEHLMIKFKILLAVSLAPAENTVMFRFSCSPDYAESLAPCCVMTLDYMSDQIEFPQIDEKTEAAAIAAESDPIISKTSSSAATSAANAVADSPFQYFETRVYTASSSATSRTGEKKPAQSSKISGIPTPEVSKNNSPMSIDVQKASEVMEEGQLTEPAKNAVTATPTSISMRRRSSMFSMRDLWSALQKTPDNTKVMPSLVALENEMNVMLSPATFSELPFLAPEAGAPKTEEEESTDVKPTESDDTLNSTVDSSTNTGSTIVANEVEQEVPKIPKRRRMSLLSPTPASRSSPPARLQPPRKYNLERVSENEHSNAIQIRELTNNISKIAIDSESQSKDTHDSEPNAERSAELASSAASQLWIA